MAQPPPVIGRSVARVGLDARVRGATRYTADLKRPGMLYGRILRSPHPHANVRHIDVSKALALPGVEAVLTYRDVPHIRIDADALPLDRTVRYVGDEVAVVAATRESIAEDALALIEVGYEPLPPVFEADEAAREGAPLLHERASGNLVGGDALVIERGDVAAGLSDAERRFGGRFHTQMHSPAGMETRAALAEWDGDRVTVWKTSRAVHAADKRMLARLLEIPEDNVRVICTAMGGGFGAKDESRLGGLAALIARKAGRPVRIEYSRSEEFTSGRNRQESDIEIEVGLDAAGAPLAVNMKALVNAGAYASSGMGVTRRIAQGPIYLYTTPSARFEGRTIYTNRPPGGSFRGLGAPLGHFALEVLIDQVAAELGIDPLDYRLAHHVTVAGQPGRRQTPPGDILPDQPVEGGVPFSSNGLRDCILQGADRIGWRERRKANGSGTGPARRGLGMALANYKGGAGPTAQADVSVTPDGRVVVAIGNVDVGQGSETVLAQIAAETLGAPMEAISMVLADTGTTPPAHITAGSSTTFTSGMAVKEAAEDALRQVRELSTGTGNWTALAGGLAGEVRGSASVQSGSTDHVINSFAAHFCEVEVDTMTGSIRVLRYVAAHDSGRIINPHLAKNQVSGGVLQFLGIALREEMFIDKRLGVTLNAGFLEHKFTSIVDFPEVEVLFCGEPDPVGPFGAKALGEVPVVPVFAAVSNAFANATGAWLHEVPFTPERVLGALRAGGTSA